MKKLKVLLSLFVCAFMVIPFMGAKAEEPTPVSDYAGLQAAMLNGGVYSLTGDIVIDAPLETDKDVTIFGNGHTIKPMENADTAWPGPNKTIIAARFTSTVTLNDVVLDGAPKYGAQAYNGGHVVLNGVIIKNSGFGAVNINGGTVTIKDLVMDSNAYGIEFGIGSGVTGIPTLVMDGKFEVKNQDGKDPICVDTDQVTADKTITVENTLDTIQTIDLVGNKITVKNTDGTVAFESNELLEGTEVTVNTEQPVEPEEPTKEEDKKDEVKDEVENPKTSDGIILVFGALAVSATLVFIAKKKLA